MKLDKELYTKHAKRLQAILNEKSTFAPYIARPDFSKVLEVSLNTLLAVEKKLVNVELPAKLSAKSLVKEFNKLGKNTFKLDENFKYDDEGDLIDNINYLSTYLQNIYKVNIDDLVEGKKVVAGNPNISLKTKPEVEEMSDNMAAGQAFAAMGGYENPYIMGKAYAKFKTDQETGKVYVFKSKPRIIPIAKLIGMVTIGLTAIALIVGAVFAFLAASYRVKYSTGEVFGLNFNAQGPGIMYILVAAFSAYPLYLIIKGLFTKNDNLKYYFNWPWILMFILMVLLFVMPDMRVTWLLTADAGIEQTAGAKFAFQAWKIMYIVILGCAGTCLVPMIIGSVCNPKQDRDLVERKLKEYADEVIGSAGFGYGPMPSAPADVQKPVDVKKTTEPKEDKKSSKDSSKHKK